MRLKYSWRSLFLFTLSLLLIFTTAKGQNKPLRVGAVPYIGTEKLIKPEAGRSKVLNTATTSEVMNDCGVVASFSPGRDSFFSTNTLIIFNSTSVNASSLQWFFNGIALTKNSSFNHYFTPGTYDITLVASNGNCSDTLSVLIVCTGASATDRNFFNGALGFSHFMERANTIKATLDSGFVIAGTTNYKSAFSDVLNNGLIIKLRKEGCIEWSKLLIGSHLISQILPLRDSGYLISAVKQTVPFFMRIDKKGKIIWEKSYTNAYGSTSFKRLRETSDGCFIATDGAFQYGLNVLKLDANGTFLWNKYLRTESAEYDYINTDFIFELHDAIYISGTYKVPDTSLVYSNPFNSFLIKLNPITGQLTWTKFYEGPQYRSTYFQNMQPYGNQLLINGLEYNTDGGKNVVPQLHWIDTSGNLVRSKSIIQNSFKLGMPTSIGTGVLPSGNIILFFRAQEPISLQPGFINRMFFLKLDSTSILEQKQISGGPNTAHMHTSFNGRAMGVTGYGAGYLLPWVISSENFGFMKIDSSLMDPGCMYLDNLFTLQPKSIRQGTLHWIIDTLITSTATPVVNVLEEAFTELRSNCPGYIDSCSVLRVRGKKSICNLDSVYTYKAVKNRLCQQPVDWEYESGLSIVAKTDSSISIKFNSFGSFKLAALLRNPCNPVKDTIVIEVSSKASTLTLGSDTTLCSINNFVLRASPIFLSYKWQDGTTDSTLTVSSPGLYWVEVMDSCSNIKRDSIYVSVQPRVPISLGADRTICNNDTVHLQAPSGFLNYLWANNYNISSLNAQNVVVKPSVDTAYYIRAEKSPGCFGYDTIRINVHRSPFINLGSDTSFCFGDSILLDAGPSFSTYLWNNGASTQTNMVKAAGKYSIIATTSEGCKSSDTMNVVKAHPLPSPSLDQNTKLCEGSSRVLDGGSFFSYLWQDSSMSRTFTATNLGTYKLEVTDANGCKGRDEVVISTVLPLPKNFLPSDTSICSYGTLLLKPTQTYTSYFWSTLGTSPSISINKPGIYWLQVNDANDCKGRDTITLVSKDCMLGLYVPTAFTPNRDGRNDKLKAQLFGIIEQFTFTIYNRWGQVIYKSNDPRKGWDGNINGKEQDPGVFVWTCSYRLAGENAKMEKGSFVLIR